MRCYALAMRVGVAAVVASGALLCGLGCHSAYVEAVVRNRTDRAISPFEVDYPSASFGGQSLAPDAEFRYRFKLQGKGALKLIYTDERHVEHSITGPVLSEGDEGQVAITLSATGVQWEPKLRR